MKRIFTTLLLILVAINIQAQRIVDNRRNIELPWEKFLPKDKMQSELTLFDYQAAFKKYEDSLHAKYGKYIDDKGIERHIPGYKEYKRWEWYWEQKVDMLTGKFPDEPDWKIIERHKNLHPEMYRNANENWHNIGATETTNWFNHSGLGRVKSIGFHPTNPDVFWVGSDSGGLWKTTDGGLTYIPLTDGLGYFHITKIYVPQNYDTSHTIYFLAKNDRNDNEIFGKQLFISHDGGQTIEHFTLPNPRYYFSVVSIEANVNQPNDIYILAIGLYGNRDGWYKTDDNGYSWQFQPNLLHGYGNAYNPNDLDIRYKFESNGKFYKSTDGSVTWTLKATFSGGRGFHFQHIAVCQSQPNIIYTSVGGVGHLGGLYKSTDGGETFSSNLVPSNNAYYGYTHYLDEGPAGNGILFVNPNDPNDIIVGNLGLYRSFDGGVTWNPLSGPHADKHFVGFQPVTGDLFEGNDGGVAKFDANTGSITNLSKNLVVSQIYKIGTSPNHENEMLYGMQDNGTNAKNATTGYQWKNIGGGDGMGCAIDPNNVNIQYRSIQHCGFSRTTDHGNSWTALAPGYPSNFITTWTGDIILHPTNSDIFWIQGRNYIKTTDGGQTFTLFTEGKRLTISKSNPDIMFKWGSNSSGDSTILKTTDGGQTWVDLGPTLNFPGFHFGVYSYCIKDTDPNTVWMSFSGSNGNSLNGTYLPKLFYKSTDGGQTWTDITGNLPDIPAKHIIYNPQVTTEDEIYAVIGDVVYVKRGDAAWVEYNTGLPKGVLVTDMELYQDPNPANSKIRIGTYGRGLWESVVYAGDQEPPTANCQSINVFLDANGTTTINAQDLDNGSTDNVGISSYSVTPDTVDCSDLGQKQVTFTVTDAAGNSDSCTTTVNVIDNLAPVPDIANLPDVTAECEVTTLTPPMATDNCSGNVTVTNDANLPFTTQGTTVVTWTFDDGNGNTTTQTQNVIINDNDAPVPDITPLPDITTECEVTTLTPPTATDNCSSNVTVTNDVNLPITTQGTTVVTWTYDDGNGNTSTQTQNVVIDDITAPDTPSNFAIGTITETGIAVSSDASTDNCGSIDHYNFYLDTNIDAAANGNVSGTSVTPSYTYTSLISGTTYELYVTAVDDAGNESNPSTVVVSTTSGINNQVIQGFNIYPNPTDNILHITADENIKHISVTNGLGQKVYDNKANAKQIEISLASFAKGTYFIKADSAGGSVVKVIFKK